jgi:hypothetical protein
VEEKKRRELNGIDWFVALVLQKIKSKTIFGFTHNIIER